MEWSFIILIGLGGTTRPVSLKSSRGNHVIAWRLHGMRILPLLWREMISNFCTLDLSSLHPDLSRVVRMPFNVEFRKQ